MVVTTAVMDTTAAIRFTIALPCIMTLATTQRTGIGRRIAAGTPTFVPTTCHTMCRGTTTAATTVTLICIQGITADDLSAVTY
jgi:hypothetical protein